DLLLLAPEAPRSRRAGLVLPVVGGDSGGGVSTPALRLTPQRRAVVDVVAEAEDHPTAGQVLERVRERVEGVGAATVYRTLALLLESGQVAELRLGEGQALRYYHSVHRPAYPRGP